MFDAKELDEMFVENTQTYLFLSQVFFKELTEEAIDQFAAATYPEDTGNECLDQGYQMVNRYFKFKSTDPRGELACEYARIFLGAGRYTEVRDIAAPYESVFTSEEQLVMQESRDDVYCRFLEDGFKVDPELHEPEDHLTFELEYLASMNEQASELLNAQDQKGLVHNLKRQKEFIDEHLLNWLPDLQEAAQSYAKLTFYIGMILVTRGFLQENTLLIDELIEDLGSKAA